MDPTKMLSEDHNKVRTLFQKYERASKPEQKRNVFNEIKNELLLHAQIEEELFYPAVRQSRAKDSEERVSESINEHLKVDRLIDEIEDLDPKQGEYDVKVMTLRDEVEHHVQEEENEVFPEVRKAMPGDKLTQLGNQMQRRKKELQNEDLDEITG